MTAFIGAALVMAACASLGFMLAAEKKRAVQCTEGFALLVKHIALRLPSLAVMDDIVSDFDNDGLKRADVLQALKGGGGAQPFNKRLLAVAEAQKHDGALYGILKPLATELGSTGYERQQQSLTEAEKRLFALYEKRKRELDNGEKCYKWLGVLAGATTVILLL